MVETPGSDGKGFSSGRGGAGNVAPAANDGKEHTSDRTDYIAEENVVNAPKEGEGYSTGRGGAANVHPQGGKAEERPQEEKHHEVNGSGKVARLGLAYVSLAFSFIFLGRLHANVGIRDKLKYKLFRKTPPV